ncbi:MAG: hypothetical protein HDQ88_05055 [Clostridia bacterium]|nr:hypothetical protein [Clostridia bacterium]
MWRQVNKTTKPDIFRLATDDVTLDLVSTDVPDRWQVTVQTRLFEKSSLEIVAETEHEAKAQTIFQLHQLLLGAKQRIDRNIEQVLESTG